MTTPNRNRVILALVGACGLGLIVGCLICRLSTPAELGAYVLKCDQNSDGVPDAEIYHEQGRVVRALYDRNFDGQWDYFEWRRADGSLARAEMDDNFDDKVDGWLTYQAGNVEQSIYDTDFNGVSDLVMRYRHGIPYAALCRPNGATNHVRIELYRHGMLEKEYRDADGDGLLETVLSYDPFGNEARREPQVPPMLPTQFKLE